MDSKMIYKWTIPVYPVDAQTAGIELENIAKKRGSLKPSYVVEESADNGAVLHKCFEWDNEKAADKYRQRQAQDLIRNIVTVKIDNIEPLKPVRAFVNVRQEQEYVSVISVLHNPELRKNMLESAIKELEAFRFKYESLTTLSELMSDIDRNIQKYKGE